MFENQQIFSPIVVPKIVLGIRECKITYTSSGTKWTTVADQSCLAFTVVRIFLVANRTQNIHSIREFVTIGHRDEMER